MHCPYCRSENQPGATRCAACTSWLTDQPPARDWVRPREGRVIAGVCRGLANHFGLPVAAVRAAFLLSTFLGALGIVAYLVLWVVMPQAPLPSEAAISAELEPAAVTRQPPAAVAAQPPANETRH